MKKEDGDGIMIDKDLRLISYKSSGAPDEFSDLNKNIFIRNSGDKKSYLTNKHNKKICTSDKKTVYPNTRKVYLINERGQYEEEPILVQEYTYLMYECYLSEDVIRMK